MDWIAFLAGVTVGYLLKSNPQATANVKALAVNPIAKLGKQERRPPKYNDDRKAWAKEREEIGS